MLSTASFRKSIIAAGIFIACSANAQFNHEIGFSMGASNYLGDIGGGILTRRDFIADMKMQETHMTASGFYRYKFNPYFALKGSLAWARISGDDKLSANPARNARNLNFRNDIFELAAQAQFIVYSVNNIGRSFRHQDNFRLYFGLGAGMAYHNPKAYYNGDYVALRPLTTEGVEYSKITAVVPASGGFYFTFDKSYRIGFDLTWRTTFTDYLDDVSTRYADPSTLPNALAIELANRTDELTTISPAFAENFTPGNKRGDASHNDSYITSSVEFSYAFMTRSDFAKPKHGDIIRGQRPSKIGGSKVRRGRLVWRDGKLVRVIRPKW
jgi:hypothetical protein